MIKRIIFVYNANSSLFAQVTDYAHKLLSTQTYQCNLCKLTHDHFGVKQEWKKFLQKLPYEITFLHKDEFIASYPKGSTLKFPAVFEITNEHINQLISADEINKQKTIRELEKLIGERLI